MGQPVEVRVLSAAPARNLQAICCRFRSENRKYFNYKVETNVVIILI